MTENFATIIYDVVSNTIIYDVVSKTVLIEYCEKVITPAGPWPTQQHAKSAAEDYCRIRGWLLPTVIKH